MKKRWNNRWGVVVFVASLILMAGPDRIANGDEPWTLFSTHGGVHVSLSGSTITTAADVMRVAPFITPPGGVRFNRIYTRFGANGALGTKISIGIYDESGNLVLSSGLITASPGNPCCSSEFIVPETFLDSQSIYFTALGFNGRVTFRPVDATSIYRSGQVTGAIVPNGLIPPSFNLNQIDGDAAAISMTLRYIAPPVSPTPSPSPFPTSTPISSWYLAAKANKTGIKSESPPLVHITSGSIPRKVWRKETRISSRGPSSQVIERSS